MNKTSNRNPFLKAAITVGSVALFVKLLWVAIETFFLPVHGVNRLPKERMAPLPRTYHLASNEALPQPVKKRQTLVKSTLRDLTLQATYRDGRRSLAVIRKGAKTLVAGEGEMLFGYRLERILDRAVVLDSANRKYQLEIEKAEPPHESFSRVKSSPGKESSNELSAPAAIRKEGESTLVPRGLINQYTKNIDRIWKEISITPEKSGGGLIGFRVRKVKRYSVFEKLGLRQGDIITAINGYKIRDYGMVMEIFQSADTLDALTLKVKRGKRELELNYEVE